MNTDRPFYSIKALPEGQAAQTLDLTDKVMSFEYVDEEKRADKLSLKVDNWDLTEFDNPTWRKGVILEATWGYPGRTQTRKVVIQKVKGGRQLTIEAHALSMLMHKITKTRVWENMTLTDIANRIENEYAEVKVIQGIAIEAASQRIKIPPELNQKFTAKVQAAQTDAEFLSSLARRHGLEFYVDGKGLHFKERNLTQPPVRTYQWFNGEGELLDFDIENDITGKPGAVTKKGLDPLTKKAIQHTANNDSTKRNGLASVIEIVDPRTGQKHLQERAAEERTEHSTETTQAGIKGHAEAVYRQTQQQTIRMTFKAVGDPDVAAKRIIILEGFGKRVSGRYYLNTVTHTIDSGGYVISCKAHTDGHGGYRAATGNVGSKAALNTKEPTEKLSEIEMVDARTGQKHVEIRRRGDEQHN